MRYLFILFLFSSVRVFSQETPTPQTSTSQTSQTPQIPPAPETGPTTPVTLEQSPSGNPNLLDFNIGAKGVYDNNTQGGYEGGDINWGVIANHRFEGGSLSLNYQGDYGKYAGPEAYSGNNENLGFALSKALSRHWTVSLSESAGIFQYGASYFSVQPVDTNTVSVNPYSSNTKFASTGVSAIYQQSLRWSYTFSASYFIDRFAGFSPFGINAASASGGVSYRITRRTTITGTYSFSDYQYQSQGGQAQIHTAYATVSHQFRNRWNILGSGGFSRSQSSGVIDIPLGSTLSQLLGTSYLVGAYNNTTILPYFQGSASRQVGRHTTIMLTGGQSVTPGNGIYLASKTLNVSGLYSYTWRSSSIGFAGVYNRFGSISNSAQPYYTEAFSASYGHPLMQHMSLNLRYDFLNYGQASGSNTAIVAPYTRDNRFSVGVIFTTKTIPITIF